MGDDDHDWQDHYLPRQIITESQPSREVERQNRGRHVSATLAFWAAVLLLVALTALAFAEPAALAIHPDCPTSGC